MQVDCLIIGQGLCGTLLSRRLIRSGKKVLVIDNGAVAASSRVAGGLINPVTGKRLVRTWLIEELLPFAVAEYNAIGKELNISALATHSLLDFHPTRDAQSTFSGRMETESEYLHHAADEESWQQYFRFNYGIGIIHPCLLVDVHAMLNAWWQQLKSSNSLLEEDFSLNDCHITTDSVNYKDISAGCIIFCDGANSISNPWFDRLPWSKDKGEVLIASIPGLSRHNIYKQGIGIVPWKDDLFWIGASHDWKYTTTDPTPEFRQQVTTQLDYWLKLPYTIVDHITALRPANLDRKPFVGFHPTHRNIGIFNGMGGKGFSLAPYFAHQFAEHIVSGAPLLPDVDINRYARILCRS